MHTFRRPILICASIDFRLKAHFIHALSADISGNSADIRIKQIPMIWTILLVPTTHQSVVEQWFNIRRDTISGENRPLNFNTHLSRHEKSKIRHLVQLSIR